MGRRGVAQTVFVVMLFAPALAQLAAAQDRPAPVVEIEGGWVGFADDGIVSELLIGGAARWYVHPRISLGPEVAYIAGEFDNHLVVTGNVTFDLLREGTGRSVIPFLVVGGGLFQTYDTFPSGSFTSNEGAFTAGGGVRLLLSDRVTAGIEARMGWEPHVRINGTIGFRFGR